MQYFVGFQLVGFIMLMMGQGYASEVIGYKGVELWLLKSVKQGDSVRLMKWTYIEGGKGVG